MALAGRLHHERLRSTRRPGPPAAALERKLELDQAARQNHPDKELRRSPFHRRVPRHQRRRRTPRRRSNWSTTRHDRGPDFEHSPAASRHARPHPRPGGPPVGRALPGGRCAGGRGADRRGPASADCQKLLERSHSTRPVLEAEWDRAAPLDRRQHAPLAQFRTGAAQAAPRAPCPPPAALFPQESPAAGSGACSEPCGKAWLPSTDA